MIVRMRNIVHAACRINSMQNCYIRKGKIIVLALMAEDSSSCASVSYLVINLPKLKSVSQFKEYFGLKRNCGGAGEIADCEAITDNSILLTYEKTAGTLSLVLSLVYKIYDISLGGSVSVGLRSR